jgi:hypothetical protein
MDPAWERFCSGHDEAEEKITSRLILITTRPNSTSRDKEIELLMKEWGKIKAKMMLAEMIRSKKALPA